MFDFLSRTFQRAVARGIDRAGTYPDYTYAGGTDQRIPVKFAAQTRLKFYSACVIAQTTNTDFINEISSSGDTVVIRTVPDITVYDVELDMAPPWQVPKSNAVTMSVNRAVGFAFRMDGISLAQFDQKDFMGKCADDAAQQQKIKIDTKYLANVYTDASSSNKGLTAGAKYASYNMGVTGTPFPLTRTNILNKLMECDGVLDEADRPEDGRWVVVPSHIAVMIRQSDIKDCSMTGDGTSTLRTGKIGRIGNLDIYSSNLYPTTITESIGGVTTKCFNMIFGHISAACFYSRIINTDYFEKLESVQSGSGMKGTQIYDWKVIDPLSLGVLYGYKADA